MYYIYGILVIICATLAICFSTIAHFVSGFIILHWIFELVAIFMYHLFYNGMKKQHNQKAIIQCIIINYILLIAGLGILVRCFSLMASKNGIVYLVSIILFSLGTFGICISDYFFDRKNIGDTLITIGSKIGLFIKQNFFTSSAFRNMTADGFCSLALIMRRDLTACADSASTKRLYPPTPFIAMTFPS